MFVSWLDASPGATRWTMPRLGHDQTVRVTGAHPPPTDDRLDATPDGARARQGFVQDEETR
jgi:hypothetical protein